MKLTEQDKVEIMQAASDWTWGRANRLIQVVQGVIDARVAPSQPLPGPNPGGVAAVELGEGWELCEPNDGTEFMRPEDRKWCQAPTLGIWERLDTISWRRPKKQEQPAPPDLSGVMDAAYRARERVSKMTNDEKAKLEQRGRAELQPTPPNPGPRHRLVDTKTEQPREDAEVWISDYQRWATRGRAAPYVDGHIYRVPITRRLVPPTGEELLGQKVKRKEWANGAAALVVETTNDTFCCGGSRSVYGLSDHNWMSNGLRTDPADPTKWLPWAKEVWE